MSLHQNNKPLLVHHKRLSVSHWSLQSDIGMLLIINFLELGVVAARVISWQAANTPSTCHHHAMALRGRLQKGTLVAWQGNGMAGERHGMCESNTVALCKSNGKDTL
jgi:hypothetical protein